MVKRANAFFSSSRTDSSLNEGHFSTYRHGTEVSWVNSADLINRSQSCGRPHWSWCWQHVGVGSLLRNTYALLYLSPSLLPGAKITIVGAQLCVETWRSLTHWTWWSESHRVAFLLSPTSQFHPSPHQPLSLSCYLSQLLLCTPSLRADVFLFSLSQSLSFIPLLSRV